MKGHPPNLSGSSVFNVPADSGSGRKNAPRYQESGMEEKRWAIWLPDSRQGPEHVRAAKRTRTHRNGMGIDRMMWMQP